MTRRRALLIVVVVALSAYGWSRFGTHNTPAGQLPLTYLDASSLGALKADFNSATGETRIIVLLSPT